MCTMLTLFLIVSLASVGSHALDPSQCARKLTTKNFDYTEKEKFQIKEIKNDNGIFLEFFVKADGNAHIIFSRDNKPTTQNEPAVEIVLGAESNTITYIRKRRFSGNEESYAEKNIISDTQWRPFWIRINPSGLIEVGKGGEDTPFVRWTDPEKKPFNHYAFASWGNEVNWALRCSEDPIKLAKLQKEELAKHLFENGNITAPKTATVTFASQSAKVNGETFDIIGSINMSWQDSNFSWNAAQNNVSELQVDHTKVENPNITIINQRLLNSGNVTISPNGTISWSSPVEEKLSSCLPKGNSSDKPLVKCEIKLEYSDDFKIQFNVLKDPSGDVESSHFLSPKEYQSNPDDEHVGNLMYRRIP